MSKIEKWLPSSGGGPAPTFRPAPAPMVPRMARSYQPVLKAVIDYHQYPAVEIPSLAPSLHDIALLQGLYANRANFVAESSCQVFEMRTEAEGHHVGSWRRYEGDADLRTLIDAVLGILTLLVWQSFHNPEHLQGLGLRAMQVEYPVASGTTMLTEFSFCSLKPHPGTSFGLRLSLSQAHTVALLEKLRVCPQFCGIMLGQPDYLAPLDIKSRTPDGSVLRSEFCYQHPRYTIHTRQQPCSVWISNDIDTNLTTYIVTSGEDESWVDRVKDRLSSYFVPPTSMAAGIFQPLALAESSDPFMLHSILCHESLVEARNPITEVRHNLYDVLDVVGEYAKHPSERSTLKQITNQLHQISQDIDSLYSSADMGTMVVQHSSTARQALLELHRARPNVGKGSFAGSNVGDALHYLGQSLDSQKRWLESYKSRKDIAMNLVFNLVTQQDSETNTTIARDTKDDSTSMKVIAVLTMIYLPASAVSSFFGMAFFNMDDDGQFVSSTSAWIFAAITVPLTLATFVVWLGWYQIVGPMRNAGPTGS